MFSRIFNRINLKLVFGILGIANGGTGASTVSAALRNLVPIVEESLSGTRTLTVSEGVEFYFNPNGANRTVKMYASPTVGDTRYIQNTGSAGNILTIQNNDGSSISGLPNIANGVGFRIKYLTAGWTLA